MVDLRVRDWDTVNRVLAIPRAERERTKRHGRRFPMGPHGSKLIDGIQASREYCEQGAPLFPGMCSSSLGNWLRPIGLVPKQFRQWFCSTLERLGAEDRVIDAMGSGLRPPWASPLILPCLQTPASPCPALSSLHLPALFCAAVR